MTTDQPEYRVIVAIKSRLDAAKISSMRGMWDMEAICGLLVEHERVCRCHPAPVPRDTAEAHLVLMQQRAAIVRVMGDDAQYNITAEWPDAWTPEESETFYVVVGSEKKAHLVFDGAFDTGRTEAFASNAYGSDIEPAQHAKKKQNAPHGPVTRAQWWKK